MKNLLFLIVFCFSFMVFAQEGEMSGMDKFMSKWYWLVGLMFAVWEYLVGISKVKSNSTIEMFINFIKSAFKPKQ